MWTGDWSVDGPLTREPRGHYLKMNQKPVHNRMRCLIARSKSRGDAAGCAQRRKGGRRKRTRSAAAAGDPALLGPCPRPEVKAILSEV